jgi:hypothetical protein
MQQSILIMKNLIFPIRKTICKFTVTLRKEINKRNSKKGGICRCNAITYI